MLAPYIRMGKVPPPVENVLPLGFAGDDQPFPERRFGTACLRQ